MKFADLHVHSVFSDGTYSPEKLVAASANAELSAIAIVDHDNVGGITPAINAAFSQGVEIVPGIELSAEYEGSEIHILGYLIDHTNDTLIERLNYLKDNRIERVHKIVGKLRELGVNLDPDSIFNLAKQGTVGRLHIARAMVSEGKVNSVFQAFHEYIGDKRPAYVLGFKFSPAQAIKLIKDAGGIPVLAHPYTLHNDEMILQFIQCGLMGIEAYYPEHSQSMINFYKNLAAKHNLLVTGGSDFHGDVKPDVKIGCMKIPYELVEKIKEAKKAL